MSTPIFLTNDEISHLTARKNKGAQIDALRRMGLPFFVNATGHPVVTLAAIEGGLTWGASQGQITICRKVCVHGIEQPAPITIWIQAARRDVKLRSIQTMLAVKKWAELTVNAQPRHTELITFRYAAERYQREILPQKALRTQQDNLKELAKLYEFFDTPPAPLNKIEPIHIRQYLDWRVQDTLKRLRKDGKNVMGTEGRVRANREKALFSHIWTLHVSGASLQSLIPVQAYAATKRLDEIPILMTRPIRQSLQLLIFQRDRQWNSLI